MAIENSTVQRIIESIAEGSTLARAIKMHGMTNYSFNKAIQSDFSLQEEYVRARHSAALIRAEEALEIADNEPNPLKARNQIDVRKWYSGKMDPKTFGDHIDVNVTQRVDLLSAIEAARARALPVCDLNAFTESQVIDTIELNTNSASGSEPDGQAKSNIKGSEIDDDDLFS